MLKISGRLQLCSQTVIILFSIWAGIEVKKIKNLNIQYLLH